MADKELPKLDRPPAVTMEVFSAPARTPFDPATSENPRRDGPEASDQHVVWHRHDGNSIRAQQLRDPREDRLRIERVLEHLSADDAVERPRLKPDSVDLT